MCLGAVARDLHGDILRTDRTHKQHFNLTQILPSSCNVLDHVDNGFFTCSVDEHLVWENLAGGGNKNPSPVQRANLPNPGRFCSRLTAPEVSAPVGLRDHVRPVIDDDTLRSHRPVPDRVAGKSAPPLVQA